MWQDLGTHIDLGPVNIVSCNDLSDAYLFDPQNPAPGVADFYLAHPNTAGDYGKASSGLVRQPASGDCP